MFNGSLVEVSDSEIVIHAEYLGHCFDIYSQDCVKDILYRFYTGQIIRIKSEDGEPLEELGVIALIQNFCKEIGIPQSSVIIESHRSKDDLEFSYESRNLEIFWSGSQFIKASYQLDADAKFVGSTVQRFSLPRLRALYLLDVEFPGDNFLIMRQRDFANPNQIKLIQHLYSQEITWLQNKNFDRVPPDTPQDHIGWQMSYASYHHIWSRYQIELVCETHADSKFWFTEKTGRCLATGKPFVLLNGPGTLAKLRDMGFKTFESELDESYDNEKSWPLRLQAMMNSLQSFYQRPDRQNAIQRMYEIAKFNRSHYFATSSNLAL